jgi:hypothetical protein
LILDFTISEPVNDLFLLFFQHMATRGYQQAVMTQQESTPKLIQQSWKMILPQLKGG